MDIVSIIKNIKKRLSCKHHYELQSTERRTFKVDDFSEPCYIVVKETCYIYKCKLCGKTKKVYEQT